MPIIQPAIAELFAVEQCLKLRRKIEDASEKNVFVAELLCGPMDEFYLVGMASPNPEKTPLGSTAALIF